MTEWMAPLLAQHNLAESWGSRFRGSHAQLDSGDIWMAIVIIAVAGLVVWLLSRVPAVQACMGRSNSLSALFRQLCHAHGLDRASRRLLKRLARHHRLQHPAFLFVEPARFQGKYRGRLARQRGQIRQLGKKLFGTPSATDQ